MSLETVGNAYFARVIHCDAAGFRRIAVVNNEWHMPRTQAVFRHVFSVCSSSASSSYELRFFSVPQELPPDVLRARPQKESATLPKFAAGGEWQHDTATLHLLQRWLFSENMAYASSRLLVEREPQ